MTHNDSQFINQLKKFEGSIDHLYLDSKGNPTIGVGFLMANEAQFCALNLVHKQSGKAASQHEKRAEYRRVNKQKAGYKANWYGQFCELVLPEQEVNGLLSQHMSQFKGELGRVFSKKSGFNCDFQQMPKPAQYALLDMAFNLGTPHLANNWPKLHKAIKQQDWPRAAKECSRRHIQAERNTATQQLFVSATKLDILNKASFTAKVVSWAWRKVKKKLFK